MASILIDHRAGSGYLIDHPKLKDIGYLCKGKNQLAYGDVSFIGNGPNGLIKIGVELKSIEDLFASVVEARLQGQGGQLQGMRGMYDVCYLLYYGDMRPSKDASMYVDLKQDNKRWRKNSRPYAFLNSFLMGLDDIGIRHAHCFSKSVAGDWIKACYNRYQRSWKDHHFFRAFNTEQIKPKPGSKSQEGGLLEDDLTDKIDGPKLRRMRVAASFSGIDYKRAESAADYFDTVYTMISASEKDWKKVDKIGPGISESVVREIRERSVK